MNMRFGVGMGRSESVHEVGEHARLAEDCMAGLPEQPTGKLSPSRFSLFSSPEKSC